MEKYYIAYERGGLIYGIGRTSDEALTDAERWTEDLDNVYATECTKDLYDAVKEYGGDLFYDITYDSPPARLTPRDQIPDSRIPSIERFNDKLYK